MTVRLPPPPLPVLNQAPPALPMMNVRPPPPILIGQPPPAMVINQRPPPLPIITQPLPFISQPAPMQTLIHSQQKTVVYTRTLPQPATPPLRTGTRALDQLAAMRC